MAYTTIDNPVEYFNTKLYTGTGATQSITGVGFQPDWVWIKNRTTAGDSHNLFDAVRGVTKRIFSDLTSAELISANSLTAFNSDGFTVNTDSESNRSGSNFVAWNWKANGTGVSNTAGTISSTVSANTTSGFSIVGYTGNATAGATVGHGLGAVPKMIILKRRTGSTEDWYVYHGSLANTEVLRLNLNNAKATRADFNNTTPTSSVFTINSTDNVNASGSTFIAYCFAEVKGYSKFGSYTGNGSTDGTFIYTGFKPAFLIIKQSNTGGENWYMWDNKRATYNVADNRLYPNLNNAEETGTLLFDFLSNGFKLRGTYGGFNGSGGTYIYMAFAENPFVSSTGIPTTAR